MLEQHQDGALKARTESAVLSEKDDDCLRLFCPFESGLNRHVEAVQRDSLEWCSRFGIVGSGKALTHLAKSKIGWLVARAFWRGAREPLQIASDWTHLFCLLDDRAEKVDCPVKLSGFLAALSDTFESGVSSASVENEPFAGALLDLRGRMLEASSRRWVEGFDRHLKEIFQGFLWESLNCSLDLRPDVETYLAVRRITVGLFPQFHLAALTDGIDLPPEIYQHP